MEDGITPFINFTPDAKDPSSEHWQTLISYLNNIGSKELDRRWKKAVQIMHEHGVAYNIFSDKKGEERPWQLDPIPFPITAKTWSYLEKGVAQRTRLLSAIYTDIYGAQNLIRNNYLPPEFIFANPRFLRQCHNLYSETSLKLHLHSTDMCRSSDGEWRVISDRTQSPSGAGYALENRIILSRILPRMFHSGKVLRLAPFFKTFTHSLMELSRLAKREPKIVMLSSGPSSPTYFEHVFLSRYLGITLVESSDLTVRNDSVLIKTLGGLHPVDVILRRIDDMFCDPLIFNTASAIGVPALTQSIRAKNVDLCNPLGSGVLETPALIPFLPKLCRLLLDENLLIEDTQTLWLGNIDALKQVTAEIHNTEQNPMVISSAFATPNVPVIDTRAITHEEIDILINKIQATPYNYVAKYPIAPSTLPVWSGGKLDLHCSTIRMFSTATSSSTVRAYVSINGISAFPLPTPQDKISVMPGALTLLSHTPEAFLVNIKEMQGSKDTWCFSNEVVEYKSMMHRFTESIEIHRSSDLSSRVADNMLWLGRYVERTEGMLRVIRAVLNRLNSETRLDMIGEFPFLMRIMANIDIIPPAISEPVDAPYSMRILEAEIIKSMLSDEHVGSIKNAIQNLKRIATSVRDRLSNDSWQIIRRMENDITNFAPHQRNQISDAQELINELILTMSAFTGLMVESMTRSMGWRFMEMGRRIERADYMLTMLQTLLSLNGKPKGHDLEALLEVADSTITYHTRYRTTFQIEPVVDLLLLDELNPRAVGFQMASLFDHVETLPRNTPRPFRTKEEKITLDLTTHLRLTDIKELMEINRDGTIPKLNNLIELIKNGVQQLANQITQHYLSRIETEKQLRNFFE
ncbi:MAG: circularly permuted type 2 ATP-grasp protein [Desulfamplus sp.]|nr:circularly permuted type 2 ATP-grasp protein [Desulfamplus sp.]MBF0389726.1 circularly permuted type 2 ATP-grasp protein [Desulfamplus sp.]